VCVYAIRACVWARCMYTHACIHEYMHTRKHTHTHTHTHAYIYVCVYTRTHTHTHAHTHTHTRTHTHVNQYIYMTTCMRSVGRDMRRPCWPKSGNSAARSSTSRRPTRSSPARTHPCLLRVSATDRPVLTPPPTPPPETVVHDRGIRLVARIGKWKNTW